MPYVWPNKVKYVCCVLVIVICSSSMRKFGVQCYVCCYLFFSSKPSTSKSIYETWHRFPIINPASSGNVHTPDWWLRKVLNIYGMGINTQYWLAIGLAGRRWSEVWQIYHFIQRLEVELTFSNHFLSWLAWHWWKPVGVADYPLMMLSKAHVPSFAAFHASKLPHTIQSV